MYSTVELEWFSNYKRINSNKYNKQNWNSENKEKGHWHWLERQTGTIGAATLRQRGSLFGTGWSFQPVPMDT